LLDGQVAVVDAVHDAAKLGQVADRLADAEIARVVAGGLIAKQNVVTHTLFDGAVFVLAANDRIAQVMVGDTGLEPIAIRFGDAVTEDRAELVGTADARAASTRAPRSAGLPGRVRPLCRLPALPLWPGHRPAHDAR
jgi:hypothetical protein